MFKYIKKMIEGHTFFIATVSHHIKVEISS